MKYEWKFLRIVEVKKMKVNIEFQEEGPIVKVQFEKSDDNFDWENREWVPSIKELRSILGTFIELGTKEFKKVEESFEEIFRELKGLKD